MRVIPSRWVSAYKSESRVRVRIVAKDLNKGISARKLGILSPTPSIEGLHFVLTLAAQRALRLKGLDVSHAFMHSPLPHGLVIVLKLPRSVSMPDGSQAYLLLYKALNGLRDASLHWLKLLSDSIRGVGLTSDEVEPCIYQGVVNGELALLVAYVDDLLLCCQSEKAEKIVEKAIGKAVPLKETVSAPERMITLFLAAKSFAFCLAKETQQVRTKLNYFKPKPKLPQLLFFQSWWFLVYPFLSL